MSNFLAFISTVRWQDVVDIVIISYILFRVYVLFQGTNAFRVLAGISSLWILQEAAASLGLILTSWAVRGITAAAAIIIVVVFRNEIRSVLQARNVRTFLWGAPHSEQVSSLEIIADSAFQMGKKRIGALLVFPGKDDLSEIIHGGIPWDGNVSKEMLASIFWPKNPVHDGAIIIKGNKVAEVGVLLPLSQRQDLPSFYGTRHRAAAGLAERSDAMVVVVSEERGRVTVAKDNWIKPIAQSEELCQLLQQHSNPSDGASKDQKQRQKLKYSAAAVLSLLIMTGVWFGFTRSHDTITTLNIPIEYVNRPSGFEILDTSADEARVQLYGSSALVRSLRHSQVQARIDLGKAIEGKNSFPITQDNITLPPGVFLGRVEPSIIDVTLDVPITREIAIQVDWIGKLPEHLTMTDTTITPSMVRIIGGSKILEKVSTIYTVPVRLDNITKSGSISSQLLLTPPSIKLAQGSTDKVTIHFNLKERN